MESELTHVDVYEFKLTENEYIVNPRIRPYQQVHAH